MARRVVRRCPTCRSTKVVPIVFGLPDDETVQRARAGEIVLGGCVVTGDDPHWHCSKCGYEWGQAPDAA